MEGVCQGKPFCKGGHPIPKRSALLTCDALKASPGGGGRGKLSAPEVTNGSEELDDTKKCGLRCDMKKGARSVTLQGWKATQHCQCLLQWQANASFSTLLGHLWNAAKNRCKAGRCSSYHCCNTRKVGLKYRMLDKLSQLHEAAQEAVGESWMECEKGLLTEKGVFQNN